MNAKSVFSAKFLICIFIAIISGCSKSNKEAETLPELISAVNFPYILDNKLYSFDPNTEKSEELLSFENNFILALDTDLSNEETDEDNVQTLQHTATAEYFVFVKSQTLHIYDLNTRADHQLYDFKKDKEFDPETQKLSNEVERYICDIQKVITWDETPRLAKKILYKDELSVYVKTSSNEQCTNEDEAFNYWQIKIEKSDETYTRRRKTLLNHTHEHSHFHDHNNKDYIFASLHDHKHTAEQSKKDENGNTLENNHLHSHEHIHDFLYGDEHQHDFLTKAEVDSVHNNLKYQEIKFETHPILTGKKTSLFSIDEALMYSGKPILDIHNRTFGYLGFNTVHNSYRFFTVMPDDEKLEKSFLWELSDDNFNTINSYSALSDIEKLIPKYSRFSTFQYVGNNIVITSNNKIHYFTLEELFDDDTYKEREASITNPIFVSNISSPSLESRSKYNDLNKSMIITEGNEIWTISFENTRPNSAELIKRFTENNLIELDSSYVANQIFIKKSFMNEGKLEYSIVLLQDSGLEDKTVLTKTMNSVSTNLNNDSALINISDADTQNRTAEYYSTAFSSLISFNDSLWSTETIDYRDNLGKNIISIFSSDFNTIEPNTLTEPQLFLFDKEKGEEFGYIPLDITSSNKVIILSDLYGLVEVNDSDSNSSIYFFSNKKSSFNFDNEYKIMKPLIP